MVYETELTDQEFILAPMVKGSYRELKFTTYQSPGVLYTDLSTATSLTFYMKKGGIHDGSTIVTKVDSGPGLTIVDASNFTVFMEAADTENIAPQEYDVLIVLVNAAGKPIKTKGVMTIL